MNYKDISPMKSMYESYDLHEDEQKFNGKSTIEEGYEVKPTSATTSNSVVEDGTDSLEGVHYNAM